MNEIASIVIHWLVVAFPYCGRIPGKQYRTQIGIRIVVADDDCACSYYTIWRNNAGHQGAPSSYVGISPNLDRRRLKDSRSIQDVPLMSINLRRSTSDCDTILDDHNASAVAKMVAHNSYVRSDIDRRYKSILCKRTRAKQTIEVLNMRTSSYSQRAHVPDNIEVADIRIVRNYHLFGLNIGDSDVDIAANGPPQERSQ